MVQAATLGTLGVKYPKCVSIKAATHNGHGIQIYTKSIHTSRYKALYIQTSIIAYVTA